MLPKSVRVEGHGNIQCLPREAVYVSIFLQTHLRLGSTAGYTLHTKAGTIGCSYDVSQWFSPDGLCQRVNESIRQNHGANMDAQTRGLGTRPRKVEGQVNKKAE